MSADKNPLPTMNFQTKIQLISCLATLVPPSLAVAFIFRKQIYEAFRSKMFNILYYICAYWIQISLAFGLAAVIIGVLLMTGAETNEAHFWGAASIIVAVAFFGISYLGFKWKRL